MRVLIISGTTWDNSNSFGNTFSNIFGGMKGVEIYNIACQSGTSNNSVTAHEIQMSDKSMLKSIINFSYDPCWNSKKTSNENVNKEVSISAIKKRLTVFFVIRDIIWKLARWKKSKTLSDFLEQYKPDIVYLPIYASPRMCDIQQWIIDKLGVPVVGHITDDVYNMPPNLSFFAKMYRKHLQKKLNRLINSCKYLEVFAENMADEYSKIFDIPCYLIGKGVSKGQIDNIPPSKDTFNEPIGIVYTGNISAERYSALYLLGKAIDDNFSGKAVVKIYTQTHLSDEMLTGFNSLESVVLKGAVTGDKVNEIQKGADLLLHIEGFSEKSLFEVKMSFSTKLIDYMLTGVPILAMGPKEANSISVLEKNALATVITNPDKISDVLEDVFENAEMRKQHGKNILTYLKSNRDIKIIQKGMLARFGSVL